MATYDELLTIATTSSGTAFQRKIRVAVIVAADIIRAELSSTANHANRMVWAKQVLNNPDAEASKMIWAVLAQNRTATSAQILAADDATVQTAVNAAVDLLAGV